MSKGEYFFARRICLSSELEAKYAILPGDPGRTDLIAEYLDKPEYIGMNREYKSYTGYIEDEKVIVISTGMGGPSTAIAVEELKQIGVGTLIRIGSCGGMQPHVLAGELIIPTGAIRQEGTTHEYIYPEFPAVPDFDVTLALRDAANKVGAVAKLGVVQSKDSFYGQHDPGRMPIGVELSNKYNAWIKAGALASEMECAALFTVAQILGVRAGAVLHVLWNKERELLGLDNETNRDMTKAIFTVREAIADLIRKDKGGSSERY